MTPVDQSKSREISGAPSITVVDSYDEMSRRAADAVAETITAHPTGAITLPTGSTPLGMYQELVRRIEDGSVDFSGVQLFCLDDYLGQTPDDEASLTGWLKREFLDPGKLPAGNIHYIPTTADDPHAAAVAYESAIREHGGLELAVVGLGPNGHIAFNEPGSDPDAPTRVIELTQESRDQNAAYYEGKAEIPQQAITMGLGTILSARRIVMIVSGKAKAGIVKQTLEGPMTSDVPGSWMRLAGDRLEVLLDAGAASELSDAPDQ
jgi:glucosamine-6-phosphate deaminase